LPKKGCRRVPEDCTFHELPCLFEVLINALLHLVEDLRAIGRFKYMQLDTGELLHSAYSGTEYVGSITNALVFGKGSDSRRLVLPFSQQFEIGGHTAPKDRRDCLAYRGYQTTCMYLRIANMLLRFCISHKQIIILCRTSAEICCITGGSVGIRGKSEFAILDSQYYRTCFDYTLLSVPVAVC
jgi:hypothetical protein